MKPWRWKVMRHPSQPRFDGFVVNESEGAELARLGWVEGKDFLVSPDLEHDEA